MSKRVLKLFPFLWAAVIILVVVPWADVQDHPHWAKVVWIPFVDPPRKAIDIAGNLLMYLPLGYSWVKSTRPSSDSIQRIVLGAAILSFATEATQLFSHSRFPSTTDLACNIAGAWAGAHWCRLRAAPPAEIVSEI